MKHLKIFKSEAEYLLYKDSLDYVTPNVCFILDLGIVYNPEPPKVKCIVNIKEGEEELLMTANCSAMYVDGVKVDSSEYVYTFQTLGIHKVDFELTDPSVIDYYLFDGNNSLISVEIPDSVETIRSSAFEMCENLEEVILGKSVKSISNSFEYAHRLNHIICKSKVAPTITLGTFTELPRYGTLEFPEGSDYSSWLNSSEGTLGYYNWNEDSSLLSYITTTYSSSSDEVMISIDNKMPHYIFNGKVISNRARLGYLEPGDYVLKIALADETNIPRYLVSHRSELISVVIPETVTNIELGFDTCSNLSSVTFESKTYPTIASGAFKGNAKTGVIYYPADADETSKQLYQDLATSLGWSYSEI